jgi:hypothetical protein
MIVCLTDDADVGLDNVVRPTPGKVAIAGKQEPAILSAYSNYLRVFNILSFVEMIIVHYQGEPGTTQRRRHIISAQIPVNKEDRIRLRSIGSPL